MARLFDDIRLAAALERVDEGASAALMLGPLSTSRTTQSLIASAHIIPLPMDESIVYSAVPDKEDEVGGLNHGDILLPAAHAPRLVAPSPVTLGMAAEPWLPLPAWLYDAALYSRLDFWGVSIVHDEDGLRLVPDIDLRP